VEFLLQLLPIIIYFLLIIIIVVGIILGIKLIITIDKVLNIVEDINDKVEKVTPLFDTLGFISDKASGILSTVFSSLEKLIGKLFLKNKDLESDFDE